MTRIATKAANAALTALAFAFALPAGAATISTPGPDEVGSFAGHETYGQSFIAGAHNVLDRVVLQGRAFSEAQGLIFELFSFNDTTNKVNGAALYSTTGTLDRSPVLEPVIVRTGGWSLTEGETYLFSFRHDDGVGNGRWGYDFDNDNYADGAFHYSNVNRYLDQAWASNFGGQSRDLQIEMTFSDDVSAVPLPAGLPFLLTGLIGFGIVSKRKKT